MESRTGESTAEGRTATTERLVDELKSMVERAQEQAVERAKAADRVIRDHPYQTIIDTAQSRDCDLIVMASHGRRGVSALLLGSETQKVLTHSKLPVIVVR